MNRSAFWKYQIILFAAVGLLIFLSFPWGKIPALGPLLSPFSGIWQSHTPRSLRGEEIKIEGLKQAVQVEWDEYGVPHIFAQNSHDLYLTQGYLTARDRLFQMDLQSRPGGGRISELVGERTAKFDEFFIKIGIRRSAQRALEQLKTDPIAWEAVQAYTQGANFYIQNLEEKDYPPEYKILGTAPSLWTPLKTAQFLKTMSFNLAGRSYDLHLTRHLQKWGLKPISFLFPDGLPHSQEDYIFLDNEMTVRPKPVEPPEDFLNFVTQLKNWPEFLQPFATNGSNNFAVSSKRSSTGYSILANDTHLRLTLPAIWYEIQLSSPEQNVYGASFPGSPSVVLGFNKDIAWGVTNGTSDVVDWYEVEFKSPDSDQYLLDGEWVKAEKEIEVLKVRGGKEKTVEVLWTRHGAVVHREGKLGLALSWTVHEPSNELKTFLDLNRAARFEECEKAIQHFKAPSQNFICADAQDIGLWHEGRFPKRAKGQGKYVMDGRRSDLIWSDWIEQEEIPHVRHPEKGYVRSANNVVASDSYSYYLGWDYDESYRARRIRELIEAKEKIAPQDLMAIQNDIKDLHAKTVLPPMVALIPIQNLNPDQKKMVSELRDWDYLARASGRETTFYKEWWRQFEKALYEDDLGERKGNLYPRRQRTAQVFLRMPGEKAEWEKWIDNSNTETKETLENLVLTSFFATWEKLEKELGPPGEAWNWGKARPTELSHVAYIPGFGSGEFEMPGTRYSPNANKGEHGATWKLVVALGPDLKAWTNIPGHNQGHPFSSEYTRFVKPWSKGEMKPVHFMAEAGKSENSERTIFQPLQGQQ